MSAKIGAISTKITVFLKRSLKNMMITGKTEKGHHDNDRHICSGPILIFFSDWVIQILRLEYLFSNLALFVHVCIVYGVIMIFKCGTNILE